MALLTDITSADWQVSLTGAGNIEQGLNDVRQCIDVILRTRKGSDPLRPQFGSDIFQYIDTPTNTAVPNMKLAILEACEIWEKRVEIVSITHIAEVEKIQFFVSYRLVDDDLIDTLQLLVGAGGALVTGAQQNALIIEGIFPPGFTNKQMLLAFTVNGNGATPAPPVYGFSSPAQMLNWVRANWNRYGQWYLLPDRIILYMNPGIATSASLNITLGRLLRFAGIIPTIIAGEKYKVIFTYNEQSSLVDLAAFNSIADMLVGVRLAFPFGTWAVENSIASAQPFNDDFSDDFGNGNLQYELVLYTDSITGVVINIQPV